MRTGGGFCQGSSSRGPGETSSGPRARHWTQCLRVTGGGGGASCAGDVPRRRAAACSPADGAFACTVRRPAHTTRAGGAVRRAGWETRSGHGGHARRVSLRVGSTSMRGRHVSLHGGAGGRGRGRASCGSAHVPPPTTRAEGHTRVTGQLSTSEGAWHRLPPETACRRSSWLRRDAGRAAAEAGSG